MLPHEYLAMVFEEFSYFHAMYSTPFKPQAYQLAMESMLAFGPEIVEIWKSKGTKGLEELPGIGPATAAKTDEYLRTGHVKEYEKMKKQMPIDMHGLAQVEGLGPKHMLALWKALKVKDLPSLRKAVTQKKIRTLKGFGVKSEEKLAQAIGLLKLSSGRLPLAKVLPVAESIVKRLLQVDGVVRCSVAGSLRRKKATIGDIDLLATSSLPKRAMEAFVHLPEVIAVHDIGATFASVRLAMGIDADLRVVPDAVYGATLQYFTGDRRHNIFLREHAIKLGYKLNEYGLFRNGKLVACKTEDEIYEKLGLQTPLPENRLGYDEFIPLAKKSRTGKSVTALKADRPKKAASPRRKSNTKSRGRKASTRA